MIELRGGRATIRISPTVWTMTLELARLAGWRPAGTQPPAAAGMLSWLTQYNTSDGQTVERDDAVGLAKALAHAAEAGQQIITDFQNAPASRDVPPLRTPLGGFGWFFTNPGHEHLHALADFCRMGSFQIH
jgi:hypothetical protein